MSPSDKTGEGADTDEEALLRKAVPNAENAVIGEDEAEADTTTTAKPKPAAKPHGAASGSRPAPEIPHVETAILHFTSVPAGAVVKTKARVLGRTPIALHFKTGNTYEIVLIKRGYEPATRKVAVHNTKDRKVAVTLKKTPPPEALVLPSPPMRASGVPDRARGARGRLVSWSSSSWRRRSSVPRAPRAPADDVDALRAAALEAIARPRAAGGSEVVREVTLPSIERLVEDADLRRASITKPARDEAFVRDTLATARAYAERVAKRDDPYRTATGELVKAYRAGWDGTLQPYALYVPRGYDGRNKKIRPGRSSSRCTARSPTTSTTCGGCSGSTTGRARPTPRPHATSSRSPTSRRSSSRRSAAAS